MPAKNRANGFEAGDVIFDAIRRLGNFGNLAGHEGGIHHRQANAIHRFQIAFWMFKIGIGLGVFGHSHINPAMLSVPVTGQLDQPKKHATTLSGQRLDTFVNLAKLAGHAEKTERAEHGLPMDMD